MDVIFQNALYKLFTSDLSQKSTEYNRLSVSPFSMLVMFVVAVICYQWKLNLNEKFYICLL